MSQIAAAPRHCRLRQRVALVQARAAATASVTGMPAPYAQATAPSSATAATTAPHHSPARPHGNQPNRSQPNRNQSHGGQAGRPHAPALPRPAAQASHHPLRHGHVAAAGAGLGAASGQLSHHVHPGHPHPVLPSSGTTLRGRHLPGQAAAEAREELLILPGQLWFGPGGERAPVLRTLLGSCVAVTLWHPGRQLGGMCHYLLPARQHGSTEPRDGRYGDEALAMLVDAIRRDGADPRDFTAHLYGGADTLPEDSTVRLNIGERNIEQGWTLIDQHGFQLDGVDVGDNVPRSVSLDLANGLVQVRRGRPA